MGTFLQDLRYAIRMLKNNPAFAGIVILTLAAGIGMNTALFSVVNGILLQPLPYRTPDRLVMVWMDNRKMGLDQDWHSYANYADYRDQSQTFESIAAFNDRSFSLTGAGEPERIIGAWSTANLFDVLAVQPATGRAFTIDEEEPGKDGVAVISSGLSERRFGGNLEALGQQVMLNGTSRTIIGIMPPRFEFPRKETDIWVPLAYNAAQRSRRNSFSLKAIGRLKPDVQVGKARSDMATIADNLQQQYPSLEGYGVTLVPLHDQVVGKIKPALIVLLGAVGFLLLIACANVANLLLAKAAGREREIAIRTALGAGRTRLVRQLLTESTLLGVVGGAVGILVAVWGLKLLIKIAPSDIPSLDRIGIDGRVLLFTAGISIFTGLIFGLVPALQTSKLNMNETLKEGGRGSTGGARGRRIKALLAVSELSLSLVLLIGAGLMIRSFQRLQNVDPGFRTDHLLTMRVLLSGSRYKEDAQRAQFFGQLTERLQATPGIESAGGIGDIFLTTTPNSTNFTIEGRPARPEDDVEIPLDTVTSNYFKVMGISLLKGREFNEMDRPETPPAVIVNETMALRFWPGEDAIGKRFKYGSASSQGPWMTIVGVVGDMRRTGFDSAVRCETFLPMSQSPDSGLTLVMRTTGEPLSMTSAARQAVQLIDSDQPIYDVKSMDQLLESQRAPRRFNMTLLSIFASVALILASIGIYGVVSYSVNQRTHEIGIRIALGASRSQVVGMILREGMVLALVGLGFGVPCSLYLTRFMAALLYHVSPWDPLTFSAIASFLGLIALSACYLPARRASRVDPLASLRYE